MDNVVDMTVVMQRLVPMVQPVQKTMELSPLQFIDKVVDVPVAALRQIHMNQNVQKIIEIPQLQFTDKVVDVPVVLVVQFPRVQVAEGAVEIPQLQVVEKMVETPVIQTFQGTQISEHLCTTPVCQVARGEIGVAVEMGVPLPAESASPMLVEIDSWSIDFTGGVHVGKDDLDDGMFEHAEASKRQRHSSQHQSAKQFARQSARKNKRDEEREEGEKGEVRREEERKSQGEGVQRGNGKEQEGEKKEKGVKEEEEKVEEVEKNLTGWTLVTRRAKQMRRMVQIFVKVDEMKMVAMEVSPEDKVQKILNIVSGSDWGRVRDV